LFCLLSIGVSAQIDTEFWFAAPDVVDANEAPVQFRITSYETPTNVTLSIPANPSFIPQNYSISANGYEVITMDVFVGEIANDVPDVVSDKGILITSNQRISVVYELSTNSSPEAFTLKGRNALGTEFRTAFQQFWNNTVDGNSSFDIVASEDNTTVNITPTQGIVGHTANTTFSISLDRGQTWSGSALGQLAGEHPSGTLVTSDKPIAITMKDDLISNNFYGSCTDLVGDQLFPTEHCGSEYIIVQGNLNDGDRIYILTLNNNTSLTIEGNIIGNLPAATTYEYIVTEQFTYITSTQPVYVLHITGEGCEVGASLLPSLECRGSKKINFMRPEGSAFYLHIVVANDNENVFTINGANVNPSYFIPVPFSNDKWEAAWINYDPSVVFFDACNTLENPDAIFYFGFYDQTDSFTGSRYASMTNVKEIDPDLGPDLLLCDDDTLNLSVEIPWGVEYFWDNELVAEERTIYGPGTYWIEINASNNCMIKDSLIVEQFEIIPPTNIVVEVCTGDSYFIGGANQTTDGIYYDTLSSINGCDSIIVTELRIENNFIEFVTVVQICDGDSWFAGGGIQIDSGIFIDTLENTDGCDTILTTNLTVFNDFFLLPQSGHKICEGDSFFLQNEWQYFSGLYFDTTFSSNACDTLTPTFLQVLPSNSNEFIDLCPGGTYYTGGALQNQSGTFIDTLTNTLGCDSIVTTYLMVYEIIVSNVDTVIGCLGDDIYISYLDGNAPVAGIFYDTLFIMSNCWEAIVNITQVGETFLVRKEETICLDKTYFFDGVELFQSGVYKETYQTVFGCDSIIELDLSVIGCTDVCPIDFPTAFSPNGDGLNDFYQPIVNCNLQNYYFTLYNRWGDLLYSNEDLNSKGWDGTFNQVEQELGVYLFYAEWDGLDDNQQFIKRSRMGNITLVR